MSLNSNVKILIWFNFFVIGFFVVATKGEIISGFIDASWWVILLTVATGVLVNYWMYIALQLFDDFE